MTWLAIGFLIGLPITAGQVALALWCDQKPPRTQWAFVGAVLEFWVLVFASIPLWVHSGRIGF